MSFGFRALATTKHMTNTQTIFIVCRLSFFIVILHHFWLTRDTLRLLVFPLRSHSLRVYNICCFGFYLSCFVGLYLFPLLAACWTSTEKLWKVSPLFIYLFFVDVFFSRSVVLAMFGGCCFSIFERALELKNFFRHCLPFFCDDFQRIFAKRPLLFPVCVCVLWSFILHSLICVCVCLTIRSSEWMLYVCALMWLFFFPRCICNNAIR